MLLPSVRSPITQLKRVSNAITARYSRLSFYGKALIWFLALFYVCLVAAIVVITPSRIAQALYDAAQSLRRQKFGWLVLGAILVVVCFPPFIGYSTVVNLCGFTYGLKGFFVAGLATLIGSALVFTTLRLLFSKRVQRWTSTSEKWQALETVIRAKGLPLIILIRISSFPPWVYANALFAGINSVSLLQFLVATVFVLPRIFLFVFIGSRIAKFSDGEQRHRMDTQTKVVNGLAIAGGVLLTIIASSLVYYLMQKQIRKLHQSALERDELVAEALEASEEAPLLQSGTP